MKKLILCMAIMFISNIVRSQSISDKVHTYYVVSITSCSIQNGELIEGKTIYPSDSRILYVDDDEVTIYIPEFELESLNKTIPLEIRHDIIDCYFNNGNLIYETYCRATKKEMTIIVINYQNGLFTFAFIDNDCLEGSLYKVSILNLNNGNR